MGAALFLPHETILARFYQRTIVPLPASLHQEQDDILSQEDAADGSTEEKQEKMGAPWVKM